MAVSPLVAPLMIRRYARTRLYDATRLRYLTMADLRRLAADGIVFAVIDAETGDDITRILLA